MKITKGQMLQIMPTAKERVENAMRYDYKSGYPEKLRFNVEY